MSFSIDYRYYPFIVNPRDYPGIFVTRPCIVISENTGLGGKFIEVVKTIVEKGEIPVEVFDEPDESILVYYTLLDVSRALDDKMLINRIALAYSKTASRRLSRERDEVLYTIALKLGLKTTLNVTNPPRIPVTKKTKRRVVFDFIPLTFTLPIPEYIKIVSRRLQSDRAYSLVNRIIQGGQVYLERSSFERILEEHIYGYIIEQYNSITPDTIEQCKKLVEELESITRSLRGETRGAEASRIDIYGKSMGKHGVFRDLFPPCIRRIIDIIDNGGNPSHVERFNLAAFLGSIGLDVDEVLEYFKKTADYDEKIARYQIEHILGLRGGRKLYRPYSCRRLKSSGLCPITEQCIGGKNPVSIYRYNVKRYELGK